MRFAAGMALVACLGGCEFAVRHPGATIGLAGGIIAGGTCELSTRNSDGGSGHEGACAIVGGAAGLALGLIVAGAIYLGGDGHTILWDEHAPAAAAPPPVKTFKTDPVPPPPPPPEPPAAVEPPVDADAQVAELVRQRDALNAQIKAAADRLHDAVSDQDRAAAQREMSNLHGQQIQINMQISRLRPENKLPEPIEHRECPPDPKIPCA